MVLFHLEHIYPYHPRLDKFPSHDPKGLANKKGLALPIAPK